MAEKVKKPANPALIAAVKAVAVLVCICLVCVALLALCNDLLYISDDEKLARAMSAIYADYGTGDKEFNDSYTLTNGKNSFGEVTDVKKAQDGAYVLTSKGGGGYKGTVTIYIVIKQEGSGAQMDAVVKAWTVKEHDGETFLGNIGDAQRKSWYVDQSITLYNSDAFALNNNKVTGTTLSSTAINNAVKAACDYCVNVLELVSTPESDAIKATSALSGLDGYTFSVAASDGLDDYKVGDTALSFVLQGVKDGADELEAFVYGSGDDVQIVVCKSWLTHQERARQDPVAKTANVSDEVVAKVKGLSYFEHRVRQSLADFEFVGTEETITQPAGINGTINKVYNGTNGTVIEATGTGGYSNGTVTVDVVIGDDAIKAWWIVGNEGQTFINRFFDDWANVSKWYVGSSINDPIALGDNKVTGASMSSTAINNAVNAACSYAKAAKAA